MLVGMVDGCGYDGQQKDATAYDIRGLHVLNDLKHIQASFSLISTDWLHLQVVQMPRYRDLAIFVVTTTTTDRQTDYFTPAHACRVISMYTKSQIGISTQNGIQTQVPTSLVILYKICVYISKYKYILLKMYKS